MQHERWTPHHLPPAILINHADHHALQILTLAAAEDWEGLELLGREKKLPVGMDVLIAACKQHNAPPATTAKYALIPFTNRLYTHAQ